MIRVRGACEHNLKNVDIDIARGAITVITGVSGSGKSSLAFDTILAESQRRFFHTLSHYLRQFLDIGARPRARSIQGLSPAIALAQNETKPSRRATVGTLTDLGELLGVLFARWGQPYCPEHNLPASTTPYNTDPIAALEAQFGEQTVHICAPIARNKKGRFAARLESLRRRGYQRAFVDTQAISLETIPDLAKDEKHTILLIVDTVLIASNTRDRLRRSLDRAMEEGEGYVECYRLLEPRSLDPASPLASFSKHGGCPKCQYAWPRLDPRYFSSNSLGRCPDCHGYGMAGVEEEVDPSQNEEYLVIPEDDFIQGDPCHTCHGSGLDPKISFVRLGGADVPSLLQRPLRELKGWVDSQATGDPLASNPAAQRVLKEVQNLLARILDVGLDYIHLSRRIRSLSSGEAQRLRIASVLGDPLRGVLYVLDEPSQGLHPYDIDRIRNSLRQLAGHGNTIILVDHDPEIIRFADWIVDLGPGGGAAGGHVVGQFRPTDAAAFADRSVTAKYLQSPPSPTPRTSARTVRSSTRWIEVRNPSLNNLCIPKARFMSPGLNVVAGVSGAGKSSLVLGVLTPNIMRALEYSGSKKKIPWTHCSEITGLDDITHFELVDRDLVAKSSVSMPATYLDVAGLLRDLFAQTPDAQVAGLQARDFSTHVDGGRCETCKGRGEVVMTMRFLADARTRCTTCGGARFRPHVLQVKLQGFSIAELLEMTLAEVADTFRNYPMIQRRLSPALQLGLGYLKFGQSTASLSGGEAQRLKLVPYMVPRRNHQALLVMDEPTTGLHSQDVDQLLSVLRQMVANGSTLVIVEHNDIFLRAADWILDLGPGSAENGGRMVYEGPLDQLLTHPQSLTGRYLRGP